MRLFANWVYRAAKERRDGEFELVDIASYNLPLLDEPMPPLLAQYSHEHTKAWSDKIASFDAYVFVTPEYNHSTSGALKNAIDYLFLEWSNKAAGFVSYGGHAGGARAVDHLRLMMAEVMVATVRAQVLLSLYIDFENFKTFKPSPSREKEVQAMFDQVVAWGGAMKTLRVETAEEVATGMIVKFWTCLRKSRRAVKTREPRGPLSEVDFKTGSQLITSPRS
jgi:NAD(P)H-dependent FMN reductase